MMSDSNEPVIQIWKKSNGIMMNGQWAKKNNLFTILLKNGNEIHTPINKMIYFVLLYNQQIIQKIGSM